MNKKDSFIGTEKETGNYEKEPLHVVIGTQEQLKDFEGPIDYGEYQNKYNKLYSYYKQIVDDIVYNLSDTKGAACPGYNYDQIIKWYRKSNANQMTVAHEILTNNILGEPYERSPDDEKKTHGVKIPITEDQHVIRFLDKFKKKIFPIEEEDTKQNDKIIYYKDIISLLCDYFLISKELIFEGKGEIYYAEEKHLNAICANADFIKKVMAEYRTAPLKRYGGKNNIFLSEYSTKIILQEYAKYIKVDESEVIKTEYAAIYGKPDYYAFGAKNRTKYKQKAVNDLIDRLLLIQEHKSLFDILP